jgi:hypothetical protein
MKERDKIWYGVGGRNPQNGRSLDPNAGYESDTATYLPTYNIYIVLVSITRDSENLDRISNLAGNVHLSN